MEKSARAEKAKQYFLSGYNCSQSVALAFCDVTGLNEALTARLTGGFGGGVGRMREVCGAVSGMAFVLSALYGYDDPKNNPAKAALYAQIQEVGGKFRAENGSVVCRELLGLSIQGADAPTPDVRTKQYYQKRPCAELVAMSADILEKHLAGGNPPSST